MKASLTLVVLIVAGALIVVGGASAFGKNGSPTKTVSVVMRDPGCHWFAVGNGFRTVLSVKGPVSLANLDEAALKVKSSTGLRIEPVGKKLSLAAGVYTITMVGQARDDNHLKLTVR